jgi:hypothetical protein
MPVNNSVRRRSLCAIYSFLKTLRKLVTSVFRGLWEGDRNLRVSDYILYSLSESSKNASYQFSQGF